MEIFMNLLVLALLEYKKPFSREELYNNDLAFSKFKGRSGRQAAHLLLVPFWVLPSPPSDRNIYGNGMHREGVRQPEMEFLRSDKEDPPLSAAKNCSWDQEDSASASPEKVFGCSFFRGFYWRVFPVT
ncbi:hypothetical protein AVEN_82127-1 [Araneus ventricosus]|uniref:Uncharacterized protein n=1 Tax=Araneus ventricosus TaxID=182803 RepID=A0A4Y2SAT8_ARAVE|nr:hypothetical protein AVEN_82127-1 [Araneus ventricosus]